MPIHIEPVSGGLVTSRDPSVLQPGELQGGNYFIYLPDSDAAWRWPGGTSWSTVAATGKDVEGLTNCRFSNGNHYLVAQASGKLWSADAETNGSSFASATINTTGLSTAQRLWSTQFDDRYYLFNGVNDNRVLLPDGTTRQHGLLPVTQAPYYAGTVASAFSANATGYYEYWYTEVLKFPDGQELESTFEGTPLTVYVTSTTTAPVIEFPTTARNSLPPNFAYYNLYRSEMKSRINDELYPIGRKIGTATTTDATGLTLRVTAVDTSATLNTGAKVATSNDAHAVGNKVSFTLAGGAASVAEALNADDTKYAVFNFSATGTNLGYTHQGMLYLHDFGFGAFAGNVIGISVNVVASSSVADIADLYVAPVVRTSGAAGQVSHEQIPASGGQPAFYPGLTTRVPTGNALTSAAGNYLLATPASKRQTILSTTPATLSFGGVNDDWLPSEYSWKATDFDADWGLQIGVWFNGKAAAGNTVTIDYVNVTVHYVGTSSATKADQKVYDAVVVEEAGVQLKYGANGKPPMASMAAIFEGSMVTDEVGEDGKIVWSIPGYPDYFPTSVYWMLMPADDLSEITYLGTVNNRLIVGTEGSLYRVNYLPNETDSSFSRGRAVERISNNVGIINPSCACLFTNQMGQQELAFVDATGIFATNGYSVRKLSGDLCWTGPSYRSPVFGMSLGGSVKTLVKALINDPLTQTVRMILSNGTIYAGSYATRHAKPGGGLKWSKGSILWVDDSGSTYFPGAVCVFRRANGAWIVAYGINASLSIGTQGGCVVREDSTDTATFNSLLAGENVTPSIKTRDMYLAGLGNESEIQAVTIHGKYYGTGSSQTSLGGTVTAIQHYTNAGTNSNTQVAPGGGVSTSRLAEVGIDSVNSDATSIVFDVGDIGMWQLDSILLEGQGWGASEDRG